MQVSRLATLSQALSAALARGFGPVLGTPLGQKGYVTVAYLPLVDPRLKRSQGAAPAPVDGYLLRPSTGNTARSLFNEATSIFGKTHVFRVDLLDVESAGAPKVADILDRLSGYWSVPVPGAVDVYGQPKPLNERQAYAVYTQMQKETRHYALWVPAHCVVRVLATLVVGDEYGSGLDGVEAVSTSLAGLDAVVLRRQGLDVRASERRPQATVDPHSVEMTQMTSEEAPFLPGRAGGVSRRRPGLALVFRDQTSYERLRNLYEAFRANPMYMLFACNTLSLQHAAEEVRRLWVERVSAERIPPALHGDLKTLYAADWDRVLAPIFVTIHDMLMQTEEGREEELDLRTSMARLIVGRRHYGKRLPEVFQGARPRAEALDIESWPDVWDVYRA